MTSSTLEEPAIEPAPNAAARTDTLAASVVILLVMTFAQRLIGFGRGIMFCRWLEPAELGQWDLAFGFLNLAAPLAVLGLPGSFGRYVEYFRQRGQFLVFLKRTAVVCAVLGLLATGAVIFNREWFSRLIFGTGDEAGMVICLALCLATVIAHNYLAALFIAVRRYRVVTVLQFVQSLGFAAVSLSLLAMWPLGATAAVIGYAAATVLSGVGAVSWLRHLLADAQTRAEPVKQTTFWAKLLPFAAWIWVINLLANLFEVTDRYMIIHHGGMEPAEALKQVGYYHSSRIIPLLFVAVTGLLGSIITPHLSHDWELGRKNSVERRLNLVLKAVLLSLFAASVAVLFVAPLLFHIGFHNKFEGGLSVLPWTLAYCAWFGTFAVAQNYLWCAERAGLCSLALLAGLVLTVLLDLFLIPRFGLEGAVWATSLANFVALSLVYTFSRLNGMQVDRGAWILTLVPFVLPLGPWAALIVFGVILALALRGHVIFIAEEKALAMRALADGWRKLKGIWPKMTLSRRVEAAQ